MGRIKIENTQVFGLEASIRGMRNPLDSWNKSDSYSTVYVDGYMYSMKTGKLVSDLDNDLYYSNGRQNEEGYFIGEKDIKLAQKLTKAGSEHCKFLRQIQVWVDLDLPRYIWSEFDTYKFNTKNSCSTMHTAHKRNLTQDDFYGSISAGTLEFLNNLIDRKKEGSITSDYFIHEFKGNLPEAFLQRRTVNTNYAELLNMYHQRKNHRLKVWHEICNWILDLPYFKELTGIEID